MISKRDWFFLLVAALGVALFVAVSASRHEVGFPLDDSWIHQTYARNLAENGEWAFIPGQPSAGSTGPLYSAVLALGHVLGLAPFVWAFLLGTLMLWLAGMMGARLAEQIFPQMVGVGWAGAGVVLLEWHMVWAAASGMETIQFTALALVIFWLVLRPAQNGVLLGAVGGLLTLTRPEGVLVLGMAGLLALFAASDKRRWLVWALAVAAGWLVVIAPYAAWNYDLTGQLLPTTADAKFAETAPLREDSIPLRYWKMVFPLLAGAQLLALPGIVVGLWRVGRGQGALLRLLPVAWAFAHLTLFVVRLPAPFQHGRYAMPILPAVLLYGAGGLLYLVQKYRFTAVGRVLTRSLTAGAACAFPAFLWIGAGAYANDVRIINTEMVETAKWIADNIPPDELLVVHDIGAVGYFAPRPILDIAGLVSPQVVPFILEHDKVLDYACQQGGAWLMVLPDQMLGQFDEPRLTLRYESPHDFANQARAHPFVVWKMRVYEMNCHAE